MFVNTENTLRIPKNIKYQIEKILINTYEVREDEIFISLIVKREKFHKANGAKMEIIEVFWA